MHGQPSHADPDVTEQGILSMLLVDEVLWSVDEVAREIGDRIAAEDGIANLYGAGLVHRCGEFVFPTRAAVRGSEIAG